MGWMQWYWAKLLRATVCRALGHKRTRMTDIIGCCARCYDTVPQSPEDAAILREAMRRAWGEQP